MRRWYGVATGGLGWSPKTFWRATLAEFIGAVDGHNETQKATTSKPYASLAEQEELLAWYQERQP